MTSPAVANPNSNSPLQFSSPVQLDAESIFERFGVRISVEKNRKGKLAFAFSEEKAGGDTFLGILTLDPLAKPDQNIRILKAEKWLPYHKYDVLFSPQWSPDGRYVLLKFGRPWESENRYLLYVLDTLTDKLTKVAGGVLSYGIVSWSPDSNYIAILKGGNTVGLTQSLGFYTGPLRLYLVEWRTEKEHHVSSNDSLHGPFHWVRPHNLLYSILAKQEDPADGKEDSVSTPRRPDIYEYIVEKDESKIVVSDGYFPRPSPNGEWIAFYGSERPEKPIPLPADWQFETGGAALSVTNRDGKQRRALDRQYGIPSQIIWLPESERFVSIRQTQGSPDPLAEIKSWNIHSAKFTYVTNIAAKDYKEMALPPIYPRFRPLGISTNAKELLLFSTDWQPYPEGGQGRSVSLTSLYEVNISSGRKSTVLTTKRADVDWFEKSTVD